MKKNSLSLHAICLALVFAFYLLPDASLNPAHAQNVYDSSILTPVDLDLDAGEERFFKVRKNGMSCASCHVKGEKHFVKDLKGAATSYPKYYEPAGKVVNLDMMINYCLENRLKEKPNTLGKPASNQLTLYVKSLSNGMPINVDVESHPEVKKMFELGKKLYWKKIGQLNMACADCHVKYPGHMLRGNGPLNDGTKPASYYPKYRTKSNKLFTLQNRFVGCNRQIRAETLKVGDPAYLALELYLTWKANGQKINVPGYGF